MKIKSHIMTRQVVACEPSRLHAFLDRVQVTPELPRFLGQSDPGDPASDQVDVNDFYDDMLAAIYPPRASLQVNESSGVAIIPVVGMITKGLSVFEQRYFGCADIDTISGMIDQVAANPKITKPLFYFNTPGGYLTGTEELAEKIAKFTAMKSTVGYFDDMCASAGYELAAPCSRLLAAPSATIGSIGVRVTYVDYTELLQKEGIKVQVFTSGQFKAMGAVGTSLTEEQAAFIQADIDREASKFKAFVQSMRPQVSEDSMQGQCFSGIEALKAGLIDGLAPDMATLLARM